MSALANIRDVLVGLTEEGLKNEPSNAVGYGLSLASAAKAHLTVQSASRRLVINNALVSGVASGLVATENRRLHGLAEAVGERVRQDATLAGVTCTVESRDLSYSEVLGAFAQQARLHDLTVLDVEEHTIDLDRELIEIALFDSGRPLIVVPPGHDTFATRRILVAWDGSAHAVRAVNDALPFLRAAEAVEIVSVVGEKDLSESVPGAELAPHLARHGVEVEVKDVPIERSGDVAETLRSQVGHYRADMLVMGSYRHSRLLEWIFGGVTHSLLKRCPVPLFMAH